MYVCVTKSFNVSWRLTFSLQKISSFKAILSNPIGRHKNKNNVNNKPDNKNLVDNKYLYETSIQQLEKSNDLHLQKDFSVNQSPENNLISFDVDQITKDVESVAIDWKTVRNINECGCSTQFDHYSRKVSKIHDVCAFIRLMLCSTTAVSAETYFAPGAMTNNWNFQDTTHKNLFQYVGRVTISCKVTSSKL